MYPSSIHKSIESWEFTEKNVEKNEWNQSNPATVLTAFQMMIKSKHVKYNSWVAVFFLLSRPFPLQRESRES